MSDGSRHSLYGIQETVYGVTPTNPALNLVRITGTTLGLSKDSLESEEIRSDRQIADFRLGANQVSGDIQFEMSYTSFDEYLAGALLSDGWATDTPIAGTDQAKAGVTRNSFTFVRHFADLLTADKPYHIFRGVEINSMSLKISANSVITGTFSVLGKSMAVEEDLTGMGTPTFPTASATTPLDAFTGTIDEGGTTIAVITELSFTLTNGLESRFVVGSPNTIYPAIGRSNLKGKMTAFFENSTLVEKFINETESDIKFTLPDGAGNEQEYIIPRIKYTGGQPDVSGEGPVTLNMPFQALLDDTEATNVVIQRNPV